MTPRLSNASSIPFTSSASFYPNINVPNPTVTITNTANNRSVIAKVADRFLIAEDVPLEVGENRLRIVATDHVGNSREQMLQVSRVATGSNRITILAGNRQIGGIKSELPKALEVAALDQYGNPLANMPITFDVLRGTGTIAISSGGTPANTLPKRNLIITTDAGGRAKVYLTLGKQAGEAGNMVRARNAGIIEEVVFTATADKGLPTYIRATAGMSQYAATSSPVLEALSARAVDGDHNVIANVNITFTIEVGDATFSNGQKAITVTTDKSGNATTRPIMGATAGTVIITASVPRAGSTPASPFTPADPPNTPQTITGAGYQITVLAQQDGPTRFTGKVLDHTGTPLSGVRVSIGRTSLNVATDIDGNFTFADQVPPGRLDLFIDGRTATANNKQYPSLHFEALAVRGQNNILPHAIHLPPLLTAQTKIVGGNADVTLTIPGFEGFAMIVKANSVTFPDGAKVGPLVVSPVLLDKLPMAPTGSITAPAWTIQPTGTRFDPPIEVRLPNSLNLKPGEGGDVFQWDHELSTFVPMGRGTVSEDAALVVTDAGSGITKAGWGWFWCNWFNTPTCAVSNKDCKGTCYKLSTGANCACVIPDPAKEGKSCTDNNKCYRCKSGKCISAFREDAPDIISSWNLPIPIPRTSNISACGSNDYACFLAGAGGLRPKDRNSANLGVSRQIKLNAYCSGDGFWKFKLSQAFWQTAIAYRPEKHKELTAEYVNNLKEENGVSVCTQLARIIDSTTCGYRRFDAVDCQRHGYKFDSLEATLVHELLHFTNFKTHLNNNALPLFKAEVDKIKVPIDEFKDEAEASYRILDHPSFVRAYYELQREVREFGISNYSHQNPRGAQRFAEVMKEPTDTMIEKAVVDARKKLKCTF